MVSHFDVIITYANASEKFIFAEVEVNLTRIPNQTIMVDGVTDFFKVELISNGKVIGSNIRGCTIGKGLSMDQMKSLSMTFGHIGTNSIGSDQKIVKWDVWYDSANPTFMEPPTIRLSRIGWAVVNNSESIFSLNSNEKVQEIQLSKTGNSYVYGSPIQGFTPTTVTPAPTVPEFSWLIIILALLGAATLAVVFRCRGKEACRGDC